MRRTWALLLAVLAGCSQGPEADLQYIKQARSLGAEWALINEQASAGKVTATYADAMHQWLRDGLQTASSSLTQPDSPYGAEIRALMAEPADAAPDRLRAHADALKQIEDKLESA
jgi:hypothetical protein